MFSMQLLGHEWTKFFVVFSLMVKQRQGQKVAKCKASHQKKDYWSDQSKWSDQ